MVGREMPRGKYPVVQVSGVCAESLKTKPVYLCGKVDGTLDYHQRFAAAKRLLLGMGFEQVFDPVEIISKTGLTERRMIMETLRGFLVVSASLCHLPGWGNSPGAREETALAQKYGLVIFDIVDDTVRLSPDFLGGAK